MLFNSIDFAVFLPIVFVLYWFVFQNNLKRQNALIVVASYVFYGWWDWRFLLLVLFSTIIDYTIGLLLDQENKKSKRKFLLWCSIIVNLGFLGFFKYYNFFLDNFITAFSFFGMDINANSLNIILPVGISFYTFQTLSYTIDIYKYKLKPTRDFVGFSAFVSFFPQLVAGPIERASNLLPQFHKKRKFEYAKAVDGTRQILWGLLKKIVIADNCAEFANQIFYNSADLNGSTLLIGVLFFTFQIYGDFSGYSDIAIGTARLFGFNLMQNFAHPFFSRNVPEFWKRWHISLTTWFRDYMFVPLVRLYPINTFTKILNVFILFVVIGFWHGASWNFILWGVFLAICYLVSMFTKKKGKTTAIVAEGKNLPTLSEFYHMLSTFLLFAIAMIFFRAQSVGQIFLFFKEIFSLSLFEAPSIKDIDVALRTAIFVVIFIFIEWQGRDKEYAIEKLGLKWKKPIRYGMYYLLIFVILWFAGKEQEFIYFQF
jgi:D-alanyl-lipoteichoic acid acyltransferase DltB (MBOAT superfamily)